MKELTKLLESNGFSMRTYIQSGNVVLQSPAKRQMRSDSSLRKKKIRFQTSGFLLLSADEVSKRRQADNPIKRIKGKTVHFSFDEEPEAVDYEFECVQVRVRGVQTHRKRVFYLYARKVLVVPSWLKK